MTTEEIAAVIARHHNAYMRRDAAALAANYADDCVVDSPIVGVHVGRAEVERVFRILFAAFPDMRLRSEEVVVSGNRAVWTVTATGTDTGGFMGLPPTGKPFSTPIIFLYTFGNDHQIVQERRMYDFSRLLLHLDGLTEARDLDGEEFGEERLMTCVRANCDLAPTKLLECVFDAVHAFSAGTAQGDDLTLLVLRFAGG